MHFYVNPKGDDTASGSEQYPFATVATAKTAVRACIASGLTEPITVHIAPGNYRTPSLCFTVEDSGTENCPITYLAEGNVTLNGGISLDSSYRRDRTLLYNISPAAVGRAYFYADCQNARSSISPLLRKTSIALMHDLSVPTAVCTTENCGVTLFEDTNGNTMLLVIDYSVHDQAKCDTVSEKTVMLSGIEVRDAEAVDGRAVRRLIGQNDRLDGITVALHPHESALIRLF